MRSIVIFGLLMAFIATAQPARKKSPAGSRSASTSSTTVRSWMRSLTLEQKIAQLVIVPIYGDAPNVRSKEYRKIQRLVRDSRVGGLILINRVRNRALKRADPYAFAAFLNRMQKEAKIPLIVAGDFERGASMRVEDTTLFPHAMAFGATRDTSLTKYAGEVTALESRALGVHWVLFPDADVNNNPDNPIINIRSYSENPQDVASHVKAFIEGARVDPKTRVLTTAKHFPGHGDTATDSHLNLAVIQSDRQRLESLELIPFRAAIAAGVDSIMSAHLAVPAIDSPEIPATLSEKIMTGLLRTDLGFKGIAITDALDMKGVAGGFSVGDAAVRAIEAGTDILLMPPDVNAAIRAVAAAVKSKRIPLERINRSLERVLNAKHTVGLDRARFVKVEDIEEVIDTPEAADKAQQVADKSVTLLRNENGFLPLKPGDGACAVLLTENRYAVQGQVFIDEFKRLSPQTRVISADPLMTATELDTLATQTTECSKIVLGAFTSISSYRSGDALPGEYARFVESLMASGKPVALVSLGSPYLIRRFPQAQAYLTTYSPVAPCESSSVRALFGELKTTGKLPVTIPGLFQFGDGLSLP